MACFCVSITHLYFPWKGTFLKLVITRMCSMHPTENILFLLYTYIRHTRSCSVTCCTQLLLSQYPHVDMPHNKTFQLGSCCFMPEIMFSRKGTIHCSREHLFYPNTVYLCKHKIKKGKPRVRVTLYKKIKSNNPQYYRNVFYTFLLMLVRDTTQMYFQERYGSNLYLTYQGYTLCAVVITTYM